MNSLEIVKELFGINQFDAVHINIVWGMIERKGETKIFAVQCDQDSGIAKIVKIH